MCYIKGPSEFSDKNFEVKIEMLQFLRFYTCCAPEPLTSASLWQMKWIGEVFFIFGDIIKKWFLVCKVWSACYETEKGVHQVKIFSSKHLRV